MAHKRVILRDDIVWITHNAPEAQNGRYWMVEKFPIGDEIEVASIATGQRAAISRADILQVFRQTWKLNGRFSD